VAYLIVLVAQFGHLVATTYLDADAASIPVIGELFGAAPASAHVVLGQFGWYSTLLFELGTKWLPFHRQLWETAPYATALAGALLATATVWRVAGRGAACLTGVILICASPHMLHLMMSLVGHTPTWFCVALLGWWLVEISRGTFADRVRLACAFGFAIGVIVGAGAASDPLVTIAGLLPFILGSLVGCLPSTRRGDYRPAALVFETLVVAAVTWVGIDIAMAAFNVGPAQTNVTALGAENEVAGNFQLWWESLAVLGNGDFFGMHVTPTSALAIVCAGLTIGAILLIPRICWQEIKEVAGVGATTWATPWRALLVFWSFSVVVLSLAFILGTERVGINSGRYLVGLVYAGAVVIPVVASRRRFTEALAVVGTVVFALASTIGMARGTVLSFQAGFPSDTTISRVEQIAKREHLGIGYAGYWDAAPVTWVTHGRIHVFPVLTCPGGSQICRFGLHQISTWYDPLPNVKTFVLVDPTVPFLPVKPVALGRPVATYHIAELTMYVYPYDVAARIQR
jgi:hypothetical protein